MLSVIAVKWVNADGYPAALQVCSWASVSSAGSIIQFTLQAVLRFKPSKVTVRTLCKAQKRVSLKVAASGLIYPAAPIKKAPAKTGWVGGGR